MSSASAQDAVHRLLKVLKLIPREPKRTTVSKIIDALDIEQNTSNKRKIQRDLVNLSLIFPIVSSGKNGEAQGWAFSKDAAAFSFPLPSIEAYISSHLSLTYLREAMPPFVADELSQLLPKVDELMYKIDSKNIAEMWKTNVRYIPSHFQLCPPKVDIGIKNTIINSFIERKKLHIQYWGMNKDHDNYVEISVQGIVYKPPVIYVIARAFNYSEARAFLLHRITAAEILTNSAQLLENFSIDEFIKHGGISIGEGNQEKIVLAVNNAMVRFLAETPISEDQTLEKLDSETMRLSATLMPSRILTNWLTSVAEHVQVIEPTWLSEEVAGILQRANAAYAKLSSDKTEQKIFHQKI